MEQVIVTMYAADLTCVMIRHTLKLTCGLVRCHSQATIVSLRALSDEGYLTKPLLHLQQQDTRTERARQISHCTDKPQFAYSKTVYILKFLLTDPVFCDPIVSDS